MKVKELIKLLKTKDQEAVVLYHCGDNGNCVIEKAEEKMYHNSGADGELHGDDLFDEYYSGRYPLNTKVVKLI